MKHILKLFIPLLLTSCIQKSQQNDKVKMDEFDVYDESNHLKPQFDRQKFEKLHSWDFGWEILKPIDKAKSEEHEKELAKQFSPGQKALYFFWYLDGQVTNGGFIQFYWNGYRRYLPAIIKGLELINDNNLIALVEKADKEYQNNIEAFNKQQEMRDWSPLYKNLNEFNKLDSAYYSMNDNTMKKIEEYARQHPDEFVELK